MPANSLGPRCYSSGPVPQQEVDGGATLKYIVNHILNNTLKQCIIPVIVRKTKPKTMKMTLFSGWVK